MSTLSTRWLVRVDQMLRGALPGRCHFCRGPAAPDAPWCEACLVALPWNLPACPRCAEPLPPLSPSGLACGACLSQPPSFVRARVALCYREEVALLVQGFKFSASPRAGAVLLALLEHQLRSAEQLPEALVAVPLHPRRARERGFDQVAWLAERLARRLGLPLVKAQRLRHTPSQVGLSRKARRHNLKGAFSVEQTLPAHVAILDDIVTTGATCEALARACQARGATLIEIWAVARTPRQ
ncbi:ComF family protein [Franzmannia qiaohouensis]|uniref:ComF family protein n=1 Tax=Franzmannia qiaohouensis TaxID=1329370 RepID=A0ABU1HIL1_9GAMM|nr:ComF family protein [Halomonas qiaohouensis]MDR5907329.1 ComF family protein [Halomonas qiaohouensis]